MDREVRAATVLVRMRDGAGHVAVAVSERDGEWSVERVAFEAAGLSGRVLLVVRSEPGPAYWELKFDRSLTRLTSIDAEPRPPWMEESFLLLPPSEPVRDRLVMFLQDRIEGAGG